MSKKKKWRIGGLVTVSISTIVYAATKEQAMEEARSRGMQDFCHQCSTSSEDEVWSLSGELDGEAQPQTIVEEIE